MPFGVFTFALCAAKRDGGLSRRPHVHPPCGMVRRCQGAARGWYLNSPHRECLYHVLGSVCGHTEGVCSLFVHLHLNREWNPCPCRSSRHLGASFSFSPPPPLTRSPSPARAGEAEMAGYSLPPSLRGSGQRRPIAFRYRSCSWDVFPYDLLPDRLRPMDLPLGQVSKWRAQRAERSALVFSTSLPVPR